MRRKKHTEKEVHAHLISVVSLEVKLVLLWKHNMSIEYLAVAAWPLDPALRSTRTDQMLVHLQAFNSLPENYMIPESTKNGVPLFYIPPGSTTPVLSLQHSGSKDSPVPKHVHTPGNNGRFSTIQCRISHSALTSLLKDWTSFVLVEGYSYIKLIYSSPPSSFYLVRLISKTPCMVLRLGFPIGTLAHIRNKIVDELREQILKLRFPHRVQNVKEPKRKLLGQPSPATSPSLPVPKLALSDRACVVVLNNRWRGFLIRYDKLPLDFQMPFVFNMECSAHVPNTGHPAQRGGRPHRLVHAGLADALLLPPPLGVGHAEEPGPHHGTSLDFDKESHSCIVQYIMFPPHSNATKDSFSTDDDNDTEVEAIDADVELNLVTECWVEPQTGTVLSPTEQHHHFHGLKYQEIPEAIFPKDLSCMSTMLTFEYLSQMCQNKGQVQPVVADLHDGGGEGEFLASEDRIVTVPFQFDLIQLLSKGQQIELFFLMFGKVENEEANQGLSFLPNDTLLSLFHSSLEQQLSDREILLADRDHTLFVQHILERERDGNAAPFSLPILKEEYLGTPDRQDTTMSFHTISSSQESFSNVDLVDEEPVQPGPSGSAPQWRCYAKYLSSQQVLLTFLPATLTGKKPPIHTHLYVM
ncbi:hypothetical protein CRUP_006822 [Coryphaenoides rupestris]|nr:hypothetical protein CRUP_006822 [Coryphaenoides rupestris]